MRALSPTDNLLVAEINSIEKFILFLLLLKNLRLILIILVLNLKF